MIVRVASSTGPPKPMPTPWSWERSKPARASNSGTAVVICRRMPSGPAATSTGPRHSAAKTPSPAPTPNWSFVPPISMPRNMGRPHTFSSEPRPLGSESRSLTVAARKTRLQRNPPIQFVHHPMKRRQMNGLHNSHIVQRHMQSLLSQRQEFAAAEAGAAECFQAVTVGPLDGAQNIGTVTRTTDGNQHVARTGKVFQLFHEDALETFVVAP